MAKYNNCPKNIEIDLYSGCPFGCVYCVAIDKHTTDSSLRMPIATQLKKIEKQDKQLPIYLSPWTDPYQQLEDKLSATRTILETISQQKRPFFVITKGVSIERDLTLFENRSNSFVALSINTLSSNISDLLEPGAPQINDRINLAEQIAQNKKIKLVIKIDPIIPGVTDGEELQKIIAWICKIKPYAVTAETLRLNKKILSRIHQNISKKMSDAISNFFPDPTKEIQHPALEYRLNIFKNLADTFAANKIKASFCKSSLPTCITPHDCRGGF